jgi:predicted nucleotidyltransferase
MGEDISEDCFEGLRVKIITLENIFVLKFVIRRKSIVDTFLLSLLSVSFVWLK